MAKEISGLLKLQVRGGAANPSPPVGPALGSKGVNIMEFCKQFNARTQDKAGKLLPVVITVYSDKSFDFIKSIEKQGGILSLLENREFINKLSENKAKKDKMFEEKNIKRIGVNLYPDKEIREINIKPYEKIE